jgi:ferredoxin
MDPMTAPVTYQVTLHHEGETYSFPVQSNQTILEVALAQGIGLPFSCQAGVCTTCAGQIRQGEVDQRDGMGIAPDLREKGYALLCIAKPCSDLEIDSCKEDEVYTLQFGSN